MSWTKEKSESVLDFLKGKKSLSEAFWGFAVFGAIIINFIIILPIVLLVENLTSYHSIGFFLSLFLRFIFWIVLSVGVWQCGRNSDWIWKWISRGVYIGLLGFLQIGLITAIVIPQFQY